MGVYSLARSSVTSFQKYQDFLAGNAGFIPAAFELISTQVLASTATTITFSSIPSNYKHLQIRIAVRGTVALTNTSFGWQYNGDTGTNYAIHYLEGNGTTVVSSSSTTRSDIRADSIDAASGTASAFTPIIIDILDFANTSKYKTNRSIHGRSSSGSTVRLSSGLWMNTAAITSISFFDPANSSPFAIGSRFSLYGVN